jgi:hypothetical protein
MKPSDEIMRAWPLLLLSTGQNPIRSTTSGPSPPSHPCSAPKTSAPAEELSHCLCPAGKRLYRNGHHHDLNGFRAVKFTGTQTSCGGCELRGRCLRDPDKTPVRQVAIFLGRTPSKPETHTDRMKRKIDSEKGREMITRRFATIEPVFGNLRHNKRLSRFTLRGGAKVDWQWKLYCLVHNIEKLAKLAYGSEPRQ